MTAKSVLIRP